MLDLKKVEAMLDWERPKTITEVWSFLSMDGYYRRLIQYFLCIVTQMTRLIQKGVKFVKSEMCKQNF